jgi:hypothetical protein
LDLGNRLPKPEIVNFQHVEIEFQGFAQGLHIVLKKLDEVAEKSPQQQL